MTSTLTHSVSHHSLLASLWQGLHSRFLFKFVLPRLHHVRIHGVRLDVSSLSALMKNRLRTGRYEVEERRLARRALTPSDVVLELGGAIGFMGLYCRKVIGVRHHVSVEANPETVELLKRNYALNGLQPKVIQAAAAASDGQLEMDVAGEFWENTLLTAAGSGRKLTVPALSLQRLVEAMPEAPTALICDIEGAEQFLDFKQLPESVKKIIMELHPAVTGKAEVERILSDLRVMGFEQVGREGDTRLLRRETSKRTAGSDPSRLCSGE